MSYLGLEAITGLKTLLLHEWSWLTRDNWRVTNLFFYYYFYLLAKSNILIILIIHWENIAFGLKSFLKIVVMCSLLLKCYLLDPLIIHKCNSSQLYLFWKGIWCRFGPVIPIYTSAVSQTYFSFYSP